MVKQPNVKASLGNYTFNPAPASYQSVNDEVLKEKMTDELESYIETALYALYDNQTGLKIGNKNNK